MVMLKDMFWSMMMYLSYPQCQDDDEEKKHGDDKHFCRQASCSCVPIHAGAFSQLEVGLVLLAASCLLIVVSLVQCYRKGIGLFRHQRVGGGSRQTQLRQDVDSLITKFDRIRMKKVGAEESLEDSDLLTRPTRGNSL